MSGPYGAYSLIRRFEQTVGEECGAQVGSNSSQLANIPAERSISVENRDARLFRANVAELASQVAGALEELLRSLGATNTISGCFD